MFNGDSINYLSEKYPDENFPEDSLDYENMDIRLNQKLCEEIKNATFHLFGHLYAKKIPTEALLYPTCLKITIGDNSDEVLTVDEEKLNMKKDERKVGNLLNFSRDTLYNKDYSDEEILTRMRDIFIDDRSDSDSDTPKKTLLTGSYRNKLIKNFPYIPRQGKNIKNPKNPSIKQ